ncbi:hypothetical protein EVAR_40982_1 [Eumeta japonica]|uniref:Uncharacterized protein n=1 Tax=Eumeta variegata TaxID=151549 RepID=A0A4C1XHL3_EUMVA|nr:hypothetical protein EVAR_40982_1 [Eumeta japonica]
MGLRALGRPGAGGALLTTASACNVRERRLNVLPVTRKGKLSKLGNDAPEARPNRMVAMRRATRLVAFSAIVFAPLAFHVKRTIVASSRGV